MSALIKSSIVSLAVLSFAAAQQQTKAENLAPLQPEANAAGQHQQAGQASGIALTIYSKATPGAIPADMYRPVVGERGFRPQQEIPGYAVVKQEREVDLNQGVSTASTGRSTRTPPAT